MDHKEVVRLNAAEKYVLRELSPELLEQFEEHFFDCAECAADIQALTSFVRLSRPILEEEAAKKVPARKDYATKEQRGWFAWLRPVIAVPAIAGLAAAVIFLSAVTIPRLKEQAAIRQTAQVYESSYRLQGVTRGDSSSKISVRPNESFALDFDFTPSQTFPSYQGILVDPSGQTILRFHLTSKEANKELHLVIPADRVQSGSYGLVFTGANGTSNQGSADPKANEVQRLTFVVEIQSE
jgi:hypothetical protein